MIFVGAFQVGQEFLPSLPRLHTALWYMKEQLLLNTTVLEKLI